MLSLTVKYALKAISLLSDYDSETFVQVQELAHKAKVPAPYFAKVVKKLARKGILESKRGAQGGIRIRTGAKKPTLFDVCVALDEPILESQCFLSEGGCNAKNPCHMHHYWVELKAKMTKVLKEVEL